VISAVHGVGGPGRVWLGAVDRDCNRNLVCAAAGPTFVLVSVVGAADPSMAPFRAKHAAAQHLVLPRRQRWWLAIGRSGHLPAKGSRF
jgi:hypothetical protein